MRSLKILFSLAWLGMLLVGCGDSEKPRMENLSPAPAPVGGNDSFARPSRETNPPANEFNRNEVSEEIRKAAYESAMLQGEQARLAGNPTLAATRFREALALRPDDKAATAGVLENEYLELFERGQKALGQGQYADAVKNLGEAAKRRPDDQGCLDLLAQAVKSRRAQLIAEGKAALENKKYPEAVRALTEAKGLKVDGDDEVKPWLAEATFQTKLQEGQARAQARQWDFAVASFDEAIRLRPDHPEALEMLKKVKTEKTRQDKLDYDRALTTGDLALLRKDYQSAINAYGQALTKQRGDSRAMGKLVQAQNAKFKKDSYESHLRNGKSMMSFKNYVNARNEFQAALNDQPGDLEAMRLLQQAMQAKR